jgi:arsenite/tail-anchored protein-transporting ATPase
VLLFTGKGGVGKTSVAAATAARAARRGARVLVTSTDPAHSLSDALDEPLGDGPVPVGLPQGATGALHGQQLDAQARLERHWHEVRDYLVRVLAWGGLGEVAAEELVLLPGLDELFALIDLRVQVDSGRFDLVVVDCAPTAETLKLLTLPDAIGWYADRIFGPGRRLARALLPLGRTLGPSGAPLPLPNDGVLDQAQRVHQDLAAVHALLSDGSRSTVRLVVNPERLVVAEAERTATSLSLFGYVVDAVVVNRVLPDALSDPYLARWKQRHAEHLATIRRAFGPTPVLSAPLLDDEPVGVEGLARLGDEVYGAIDEQAVLYADRPVTLEADGDGYLLRIALPFATKDDLELHQAGGTLHLKVAGAKRALALPAALRGCEVEGAGLADGWLGVRFRVVAPVPAP